jgi:hypothetical protein
MKRVTPVTMSRLSLYFGLIKTTMNRRIDDDGHIFVQLLDEIVAFKTSVIVVPDEATFVVDRPSVSCACSRRDAAVLLGISKALETYSEALP